MDNTQSQLSNMSHTPVMQQEVLKYLDPKKDGQYIDCTFGRGGHSQSILQAFNNTHVLAIDQDKDALPAAQDLEATYKNRFTFVHDKFSNIDKILATHTINTTDGILFDLGVSSPQLFNGMRGFSFLKNGPLSMKMDESHTVNNIIKDARFVVNTYDEESLAHIFWTYGEERYSKRFAKKIVENRKKKSIDTTFDLLQVLGLTYKPKTTKIHPATRIFQALRIFVNDEIEELKKALHHVYNLAINGYLSQKAHIVIISFHSLEDRIIKHTFRTWTDSLPSNRYTPENQVENKYFTNLTRQAIKPSKEEIISNPRARSAKLRAVSYQNV